MLGGWWLFITLEAAGKKTFAARSFLVTRGCRSPHCSQTRIFVRPMARPHEEVMGAGVATGDGVWLMGGSGANSVAVEFKDFIAVVEAPTNEARSNAVIAEVKKTIPNKPIRYVVVTHHHFDHLGGIRTYAAEGATVLTEEHNKD